MNNNLNMPLTNVEALVKTIISKVTRSLNVCLPATVIAYDNSKNTVKLQPAIQTVLPDKTFQDMPLLLNVPVLEIGGKGLSIKIPLEPGDTGIVIFCDRDITLFKQEKKNTQPNTLRKHDLGDGIFVPMQFGNSGASDNITIQSADGSTKLEITSSGISIKGDVTVEGDVVADGISLKNHTHQYTKAKSARDLVSVAEQTQPPTA